MSWLLFCILDQANHHLGKPVEKAHLEKLGLGFGGTNSDVYKSLAGKKNEPVFAWQKGGRLHLALTKYNMSECRPSLYRNMNF